MRTRSLILVLFTLMLIPALAPAFQPKKEQANLSSREFFLPELYLSSAQISYQDISSQLPNTAAWNQFYARNGSDFHIYFDPRSGVPVSVIGHIPMIPGGGADNAITMDDMRGQFAKAVTRVTPDMVGKLFVRFLGNQRDALGIDLKQLGEPRVTQVTDYLWNISIPQQVRGIPVRWSRFAGVINHGNLVIFGAENWGNVKISTSPRIGAAEALSRGFAYVQGRLAGDTIWKQPALEIIPVAPPRFETGAGYSGPVGPGYGHRLAWTFGFKRDPDPARWQISVDARTGEVLEMADQNHYVDASIKGNTYPLTNTEVCVSNDKCGVMVNGSPMPFANTGLPAPNNFTNSAGWFDYTSGTVTTTLNGKYVRMTDTCSSISVTGTPSIDLGGVNGQHDCTVPGPGGVTSAVRSGMFELNKIFEEARGYLPNNNWLNGIPSSLTSNMNIQNTCNAFYDGDVNFYRSGGGCRNTGEIAAVFDHEWGHGMDDNDGNGLSNSSEGYADIASMYRLWASCVGYGFFWTINQNCGMTSDGTGFNNDESQQGASHCDTDCSGVRDSDWAKHADGLPDTVTFTCASCLSGGGPCGRQVHCAATPVRQMAWDLVARDLPSAPFNYDANTSFIIGDKLFYQGSGNVGSWHSCTCPSTASGCGTTNGYMSWIAADDDNGNLNDGTPHMTALFDAYNRHGIACATPAPVNSGCAGGPTAAPVISALPGNNSVTLTWSAVSGAVSYNIFRGEGFAGCDFGKTLVGNTTELSFTDTQVINDREYAYVVMAVGSTDPQDACFSPASSCSLVSPQPCVGTVVLDQATYSCGGTININMADGDLSGSGTHSVTVTSTSEPTPETVNLTESPANSGRFFGSINTTSAPPATNGVLSVANGDQITVTYHDDSYCGAPQDVSADAVADCVAPAISNVGVINIKTDGATVTWNTNETANARTTHAIAPGPPNVNTDDLSNFGTSHSVAITGLNGCTDYVFTTTSADPAGNSFTDDNGGSFYTFTTGGLGFFLSDDTESGGGDWIASGTGTSDFHIDTCKFNSPSHAWKAGSASCPGVYSANVTTTLTSAAAFAIEDGSRLRYAENYKTQQNADLCKVQISTDGGANWTNLASYSGDSGGWQQKDYDLSPYAGTSSLIRFQFTSNGTTAFEGWYIDDIQVTRVLPCVAAFAHKRAIAGDSCSLGGSGDGNGILDPGETASLQVTAVNLGSVGATGISGHLSTTTAGVTITDADATFPDIASGGTGNSDAPHFAISVATSVPCGTNIQMHMDLTTDQGPFSYDFTVTVGTPTTASVIYNPTDVPKFIPDAGAATSVINIGDTHPITDVNVTINILHPFDADLDLFLQAPGGSTSVELSTDNGGSGANYTNTVLDDQAINSITTGSAPFNGTFRPEGLLSDVNGMPANGAWTLSLTDDATGNSGLLLSWSMRVTTNTGNACTVCANCPTITLSPATLPNGSLSAAYSQTITASGGTAPYTFTVSAGSLPPGLTLSPSGALTGIPTSPGTFNFTVSAADQTGCPGSQAYSITVGTCLFCDDFEDGVLSVSWSYVQPTWSESGGTLIGSPAGKKAVALASPAFGGCSTCFVEATLQTAGGTGNKVSLFGWYVDSKNNVELLMKQESGKWLLKERVGGTIVSKGKATLPININQLYRARITFTGTQFDVTIDGAPALTIPAAGAHTGTVGFQVKSTTGTFGEVIVN